MGSKKITIKLITQSEVARYIHNISSIHSDVNAIKGSLVFDAKSVVAVLNLSHAEYFDLEIISDDPKEISHFNYLMKEFTVEEEH